MKPMLIFFLCINLNLYAQYDTLVNCFGGVEINITLIDSVTIGDTVWYNYHDDYFDSTMPSNVTFSQYHLHDSIFFQLNGTDYFLGDNNAQINDIWHPVRLAKYSYKDLDQFQCPGNMNLKVTDINNVMIEGQTKRLYFLEDMDELGFDTIMFLEKYGVVQGGPLFNFSEQQWCDGRANSYFFQPELLT